MEETGAGKGLGGARTSQTAGSCLSQISSAFCFLPGACVQEEAGAESRAQDKSGDHLTAAMECNDSYPHVSIVLATSSHNCTPSLARRWVMSAEGQESNEKLKIIREKEKRKFNQK